MTPWEGYAPAGYGWQPDAPLPRSSVYTYNDWERDRQKKMQILEEISRDLRAKQQQLDDLLAGRYRDPAREAAWKARQADGVIRSPTGRDWVAELPYRLLPSLENPTAANIVSDLGNFVPMGGPPVKAAAAVKSIKGLLPMIIAAGVKVAKGEGKGVAKAAARGLKDPATALLEAYRGFLADHSSGYVPIYKLRERLGWPRNQFDEIITDLNLRDNPIVELHRGDPLRYTPEQSKDSLRLRGRTYRLLRWR